MPYSHPMSSPSAQLFGALNFDKRHINDRRRNVASQLTAGVLPIVRLRAVRGPPPAYPPRRSRSVVSGVGSRSRSSPDRCPVHPVPRVADTSAGALQCQATPLHPCSGRRLRFQSRDRPTRFRRTPCCRSASSASRPMNSLLSKSTKRPIASSNGEF